MSSSLTRMTAFWPPDDPPVLSRMGLEGRASRFHCCLANGRLRRVSPIVLHAPTVSFLSLTAATQGSLRAGVFMPQTGPPSAPDDEIECLVERSALSSSNKRTQPPMEPIDDGAMSPVSISVRKPLNRTPLAMQKCPIHRG